MSARWDAIVAGGGPAGAVCATMLARRGRRVLLLERDASPRERVGESLSPAASRMLEAVGAGDRIRAAGFVAKSGATFAWGAGAEPWTVRYDEDGPAVPQARRGELDRILLEHAAASGVEVRPGCRVLAAVQHAGRVVGVLFDDRAGLEREERAPWLVDATGRGSLMARRLGPRQGHPRLQHSAVWSYWEGVRRLPGRDAGNTVLARSELGSLWFVPLDDRTGRAGVGVVVGPDECHELVYGVEPFYEDAIAATPAIARLLAGARRVAPVDVAATGAYCASRLAGPGWLLAGDSACFVDPILTPGVQVACRHGDAAAAVIDTALAEPSLEAEALALYDTVHREEYETFASLCVNLYGRVAAGPREAATDGGRLSLLSLVSGLPGPRLVEDLSRYTAMRQRAGSRGGRRLGPGEEEGFAFLALARRAARLRTARPERVRGELTDRAVVSLAPGVSLGDRLFLPDRDAGPLVARRAVVNRFGDRFQPTAELEALLASLDGGVACLELERRLGLAPDARPGGQRWAFRRWLELLADHALVEWGRRPPPPVCTGEPCAE